MEDLTKALNLNTRDEEKDLFEHARATITLHLREHIVPIRFMPLFLEDAAGLLMCIRPARGMKIREANTGREFRIVSYNQSAQTVSVCAEEDYQEIRADRQNTHYRATEVLPFSTRLLFVEYASG